MTDEEIMPWLNDAELSAIAGRDDFAGEHLRVLARSLAEARVALAACEWAATDQAGNSECPLCFASQFPVSGDGAGKHEPTCIFTTMPRVNP